MKFGELQGKYFPLGHLVFTASVNDRIADDLGFAAFCIRSLKRHINKDWGDMDAEDKRENEFSIDKPLRIFSSYNYGEDKIWIITEADRSATTILLPSDY